MIETLPGSIDLSDMDALRIENAVLKMQRAQQEFERLREAARVAIRQVLEKHEVHPEMQAQYAVNIDMERGLRQLNFVDNNGQQPEEPHAAD